MFYPVAFIAKSESTYECATHMLCPWRVVTIIFLCRRQKLIHFLGAMQMSMKPKKAWETIYYAYISYASLERRDVDFSFSPHWDVIMFDGWTRRVILEFVFAMNSLVAYFSSKNLHTCWLVLKHFEFPPAVRLYFLSGILALHRAFCTADAVLFM